MYHCIINPASGRGDGLKIIPAITDFMNSHGKKIETKITQSSQDTLKLAKEAYSQGSQGIIGVGGDGTIQEIATGMLEGRDSSDIPLGIISCGSGNDLKRTLDLKACSLKVNSTNTSSLKVRSINCLNSLLKGESQTIDAIRANGMVCLNVANIGLDAQIVRNARPIKKILGRYSYVVSAIISIFRHKNIHLSVRIDNEPEYNMNFTLAAICNGRYYGGGMKITPGAVPDDGFITLCLIDSMPPIKALALFPLVLMGKHTRLKAVRYIKCSHVTIIAEDVKGSVTLCMDGNLYECDRLMAFEILPKAIRITS